MFAFHPWLETAHAGPFILSWLFIFPFGSAGQPKAEHDAESVVAGKGFASQPGPKGLSFPMSMVSNCSYSGSEARYTDLWILLLFIKQAPYELESSVSSSGIWRWYSYVFASSFMPPHPAIFCWFLGSLYTDENFLFKVSNYLHPPLMYLFTQRCWKPKHFKTFVYRQAWGFQLIEQVHSHPVTTTLVHMCNVPGRARK